MAGITRRRAIAAGAAAGVAVIVPRTVGAEPNAPQLWTLEGELKVHPKFYYRYYLMFGDGQKCALYGADHGRDPEQLSRLRLPARIRVRGQLGTSHHRGGANSALAAGWELYMNVHEVEALK